MFPQNRCSEEYSGLPKSTLILVSSSNVNF